MLHIALETKNYSDSKCMTMIFVKSKYQDTRLIKTIRYEIRIVKPLQGLYLFLL